MATKRKPLGPRISVEFGASGSKNQQKKDKGKNFVRMLESTAKLFGFKQAQDSALAVKKGTRTVTLRGEKSTSIKIPTGKKLTSKKTKLKYDQLKSVPVPSDASLAQIKTFLRKAKKRPKYFVSPDGRQHSLNAK